MRKRRRKLKPIWFLHPPFKPDGGALLAVSFLLPINLGKAERKWWASLKTAWGCDQNSNLSTIAYHTQTSSCANRGGFSTWLRNISIFLRSPHITKSWLPKSLLCSVHLYSTKLFISAKSVMNIEIELTMTVFMVSHKNLRVPWTAIKSALFF